MTSTGTGRQARVFVPVRATNHDTSPAAKFGPVVVLLERAPHFLNCADVVEQSVAAAEAAGYDPDVDALALTGPQTCVNLVAMALFARYGHLRILVWDARAADGRGEYRDRVVRTVGAVA